MSSARTAKGKTYDFCKKSIREKKLEHLKSQKL